MFGQYRNMSPANLALLVDTPINLAHVDAVKAQPDELTGPPVSILPIKKSMDPANMVLYVGGGLILLTGVVLLLRRRKKG